MTVLRICFVGDSITQGTVDDDCLGWPGRLCSRERLAGHDITGYNLGVRAETTSDIRARWRAECEPRLPDEHPGAIVLAFGVNDMAEEPDTGLRVPPEESLENARAIVSEARAWRPVLWIGPAPVDLSFQPFSPAPGISYSFDNDRDRDLDRAYSELAAGLEVPYLSVFGSLSADRRWAEALVAGDGVHPSGQGYAALAELVGDWSAWRRWLD